MMAVAKGTRRRRWRTGHRVGRCRGLVESGRREYCYLIRLEGNKNVNVLGRNVLGFDLGHGI